MSFVQCEIERNVPFDSLRVGDYMAASGEFFMLRQVVVTKGDVYKRSVLVGRVSIDRAVLVVPDGSSATPRHHGSSELVHKVILKT